MKANVPKQIEFYSDENIFCRLISKAVRHYSQCPFIKRLISRVFGVKQSTSKQLKKRLMPYVECSISIGEARIQIHYNRMCNNLLCF